MIRKILLDSSVEWLIDTVYQMPSFKEKRKEEIKRKWLVLILFSHVVC